MNKRYSLGLLVLTTLFEPTLLIGCFSATPWRPERTTDASSDVPVGQRAQDARSDGLLAVDAKNDSTLTSQGDGMVPTDAVLPSLGPDAAPSPEIDSAPDSGACSGDACGCPPDTLDCGGSGCIDVYANDKNHCGSCLTACGPNRECQSGTCKCSGYAFPAACGGCGDWGFDSGSAEGWKAMLSPDSAALTNGAQAPQWVQVPARSGSGALGIVTTGGTASFGTPLCATGARVDLSDLVLKAYVRLSDAGIGEMSMLFVEAWTSSTTTVTYPVAFAAQLNLSATDWQPISYRFPAGTEAESVTLRFNPSPSWSGTIFIDSVQIGP